MKRNLAVVAAALGLLVSAGTATAAPGDSALQLAGQAAGSGQAAGAQSGASQSQPTNRNISVRVLSPGDNGDVTQSNSVDSGATAGNANVTGQSAEQAQSGSCGCSGGTQAVGQEADSSQAATALSYASQSGAGNTNIPVRVLSPGDNGDVSQSNSVESDATAANANATGQSAGQAAAGGSGTQAIGQEADSEQEAAAASGAEQTGAENTNISVRVLSDGDDGDVDQSNSVGSSASAGNLNLTGQDAAQAQAGSGGTQAIGQEADSDQSATTLSAAKQHGATNRNIPVRVSSSGDGGSVEQSNSVDSHATAVNLNATGQDADQAQAGRGTCGCASDGIQAIGQDARNEQSAGALSIAAQSGASNENTPVRVDSKGDDGDVSQSNSVDSAATALNGNLTKQDADQAQAGSSCGCSPTGIQAIGQEAKSEQGAAALSLALQEGASNENAPVRVDSHGGGGSVDQSNSVGSSATAANLNALGQDADQAQGGGQGIAIQAIGQSARNDQTAIGLSAALQSGASNRNAPVAVDSSGGGGDVSQSNSAESDATALNANLTGQGAGQTQGGRSSECGCRGAIGIQAIGQESENEQGALAASMAARAFGHDRCGCSSGGNANTPVGVGGHGSGGSVDQSSKVSSSASALNLNALVQGAGQAQSGGGTQAVGQSAKSRQHALGLSAALQLAARNGRAMAV